jgi:hypothetical protein
MTTPAGFFCARAAAGIQVSADDSAAAAAPRHWRRRNAFQRLSLFYLGFEAKK